jgi:ribonuclease VapC
MAHYATKLPLPSFIAERSVAFALDASALLAYLFDEPGREWVENVLEHSVMSAVNWAEVIQKHISLELDSSTLFSELRALGLQIVPFDPEDAEVAAALLPLTRERGLSLGDRACLALAQRWQLSALTADRAWRELGLGLKVELIR